MAAPHRGNTGYSTYFITASSFQKQSIFQSERMANLFVEVLLGYRTRQKYLLHEFVLMPNHWQQSAREPSAQATSGFGEAQDIDFC